MNNPILLYTLLAEFYEDCCEKTMHMDDLYAIKRTMNVVAREFPYNMERKSENDIRRPSRV